MESCFSWSESKVAAGTTVTQPPPPMMSTGSDAVLVKLLSPYAALPGLASAVTAAVLFRRAEAWKFFQMSV